MAVEPELALLDHFGGQVGGDDLNLPTGKLGTSFLKQDRQGIRFLAGGGRRAPDPQPALGRAADQRLRQQHVAEQVERRAVAEEEGLVGGHRLDDRLVDRRIARELQGPDEVAQRREAEAPADGREAALDEVAFLRRQREAGPLLEVGPQIIEFDVGHATCPVIKVRSAGPISGSGRMAWASPALATLPGMPQTVLVASS